MAAPVLRVLVLRCGALGDLVCATSVIEAVRAQFGTATVVDVICTPGSAGLFEHDDRVHRVFQLRHRHVPRWLSVQKQAIVRASRRAPYDLLLNLESGRQFESLAVAISAHRKTGWFFSDPKPPAGCHSVDFYKSAVTGVIDPAILAAACPTITGAPFTAVQQKFALPARYLALCPGNSHAHKQRLNHRAWPIDHWRALLALLPHDLPVVVVGAPGEEPLASALGQDPSRLISLVGQTSVAEMVAIIAQASALVVTDTGPGHIAAAVNTPVISLIGPTAAGRTAPFVTAHNAVHTLSVGLPCAPCHDTPAIRQCQSNRCMQELTPQRVLHTLQTARIIP